MDESPPPSESTSKLTPAKGDDFEDRNCGDFDNWQAAQDFFLSEGGPDSDPHRLDHNGDGIACESLSGAPEDNSEEDDLDEPPPPSESTPKSTPAKGDDFEDRNCGDFDNWQAAQDFFIAEGGPDHDPHRLDGNKDGIACESLPGAPKE